MDGCLCASDPRFIQLALGSCYTVHVNTIVNIIKVYIERINMQVEVIRFRQKYRIYSRSLLQSEEFFDQWNVYAARSMDLCGAARLMDLCGAARLMDLCGAARLMDLRNRL